MSAIFPQENATSTSPADDVEEKLQVNLDEETEVEDPEADVNERFAPPPASDLQPVRWSLAEKGVVPSVDKNKKSYLAVYLTAEILGVDGFDGYKINNHYMNSIARKVTTEVHHFMNSIGEPLPNRIKLGDMKQRIEEALAKNPSSYVETDWRTGYSDPSKVDPRTHKPAFVEYKKSMSQFPLVDDPENPGQKIRQFWVPSPKDGEPLYAQLYIKQILSPQEVQKRQQKQK